MRRVLRSQVKRPVIFGSSLVDERKRSLWNHYAHEEARRHQRRAPVDFAFYERSEVREALTDLFENKCAYCERTLGYWQEGNIEHFRPLGYAQQSDDYGPIDEDHYAWLAYEWNNLLLACPDCQRNKRNIFPVRGERGRLLALTVELNRTEKHTLLNPCLDHPNRHLWFSLNGEVKPKTTRGRLTIEVLQLNRDSLVQERGDHVRQALKQLRLRRGKPVELDDQSVFSSKAPFIGAIHTLLTELIALAESLEPAMEGRLPRNVFDACRQMPLDIWREALNQYETSYKARIQGEHQSIYIHVASDKPIPFARIPRASAFSYVSGVKITNFKGISDFHIQFKIPVSSKAPCAVLLGENGVGKSTVLQAIALCLLGRKNILRLKLRPHDFVTRAKQSAFIQVWLQDGIERRLHLNGVDGTFDCDEDPACFIVGYGAHRIFDVEGAERKRYSLNRTLFSSDAKIRNSKNWLAQLMQDDFHSIARAMRLILALNEDDELERTSSGQISVRTNGEIVPIEELSEGYRSLFAMAADLMRELTFLWGALEFAHGVVLIDELELHLHPRWKMRILSALRAALPKVQFIVTTHDPLCLRGALGNEVSVMRRNDEREIELLNGLPDVSRLRTDQLLTSDYFGLESTSDPEWERELAEYSALLTVQNRDNSKERRLAELREKFQQSFLIGDSMYEQIAYEAVLKLVQERKQFKRSVHGETRRDAVEAVLEELRKYRG